MCKRDFWTWKEEEETKALLPAVAFKGSRASVREVWLRLSGMGTGGREQGEVSAKPRILVWNRRSEYDPMCAERYGCQTGVTGRWMSGCVEHNGGGTCSRGPEGSDYKPVSRFSEDRWTGRGESLTEAIVALHTRGRRGEGAPAGASRHEQTA